MLKKERLILELEFYDRNNRYDVKALSHVNLICRKCGKIEDFMEALPFYSEKIEVQTRFRPIEMRFEYHGYCRTCRGKFR